MKDYAMPFDSKIFKNDLWKILKGIIYTIMIFFVIFMYIGGYMTVYNLFAHKNISGLIEAFTTFFTSSYYMFFKTRFEFIDFITKFESGYPIDGMITNLNMYASAFFLIITLSILTLSFIQGVKELFKRYFKKSDNS